MLLLDLLNCLYFQKCFHMLSIFALRILIPKSLLILFPTVLLKQILFPFNFDFISAQIFSIGFRSGLYAGQSTTVILFSE